MSQQASPCGTTRAGDGSERRPAIRVARSHDDLRAVGALRYRVYVEEMGRVEPHADHAARTVIDPEDERAVVLGAFDAEGKAIGTVRWQHAAKLSKEERCFHGLDSMPHALLGRSSLTSKLITNPTHRRGSVTTRLMLAVLESGYGQNQRLNLINCNPPLDRFFARFGFVPLGEPRDHPVYGSVRVMMLPTADLAFFEAIGSPFAPLLRELGPDNAAALATRDWAASLGVRYWEGCPGAASASPRSGAPGPR